jgi:hypothetical protein
MLINGTDWIVIAAGLGAIGWVNWYFFVAGRSPAPAPAASVGGAASGAASRSRPSSSTAATAPPSSA